MPSEQYGHRPDIPTGRAAWWGKKVGGVLGCAAVLYVVVIIYNAPPNKDHDLYLEYKLERQVARICKDGSRVWSCKGRLWVMATRPGTWMDAQVDQADAREVCE